jgi:hypothetical protein
MNIFKKARNAGDIIGAIIMIFFALIGYIVGSAAYGFYAGFLFSKEVLDEVKEKNMAA